ncbi:protein unc-13 homolog [Impatiens glandulifera]|uniref:protein unc-13 homolog n=1 Tax=Impatiens glandulifera TaxID=253017 RepID=UPI001FB177EF|nr:protein unc-13 homolog [Impatiens glandulifera]
MGITTTDDGHIPILSSDHLSNPFSQLGLDLSDSDLRETAYELLVGACRSTGGKPLTYISQSQKAAPGVERSPSLSISPSLQRSLTLAAASKVKKALGLKSSKNGQVQTKKPVTVGELIRVQMRISEQTDSRIRRGHLRVSSGQLGRRIDTMVLPLELLQQFKPSDFPNQREYESWQRRNLRILEAGLLLHPHLPLDKNDANAQKLQQIINGASNKPLDAGKYSEQMQILRNSVLSLACRSKDGSSSEKCHWADGYPLNLRIYQSLLESCFDVNDETSVVEEVDEVLELVKRIWVVLGMNQLLHNLIFSWVFFNRYVSTGQVNNDLLIAASNLLLEVEKGSKTTYDDSEFSRASTSVSRLILGWAEKRLVSYHDTFYSRNIGLMRIVVSLAVTSGKIMGKDVSLDDFIRSSVRSAFAQASLQAKNTKMSSTNQQQNLVPLLSIISQEITELVYAEKELYCPVLKRWNPRAAGVAVATYHACFGNELRTFVSNINELSPDAVQVLLAADKLERLLVRTAVEDSVDSEDGGKGLIQAMAPYEAENVIVGLVKSWISTRVDRLMEWVDRNLQQEVWNPKANKEQIAPSAVEVLRIMDETIEAFFLLPITKHPVLLPDLISGLDLCLLDYISKAKSGCGSRSTYIPTIPALTRCKKSSKFQGVFKKKEPSSRTLHKRKPQAGTMGGDIQQYCVRINTLQHIRSEMEALVKKAINHLRNSNTTHVDDINKGLGKKFELSVTASSEGIHQLCETTAYKIVLHELSHALFENLYVGIGEASVSRIEPFLQDLEQYLEVVSITVHDRARTRLITDIMKASFDGFLFVLLAGGPLRGFTRQDGDLIEEDFKFLKELFWSNGDGLPDDLIDKHSTTVKSVLPLFHMDSHSLIDQFRRFTVESYGSSAKSRLPLPPTSGQWSPIDPNTLLRVLCYRNDETATKFLKKTYHMPKKL